MKCGLLGRTLGHSYSPQIHSYLGDYSYELFEKEPEELENFLKNGDFHGLNVTIPYKKAVIPYLHDLSPIARRLGAVNTIIRRGDGSLYGHNTDYYGFQCMVQKSGLEVRGKKCLVLGSGGASVTVRAVLDDLGAHPVVISRSGPNNYGNLDRHADAAVIVNTTPVGMYPDTGSAPLDITAFPQLEGVLDLIYNPAKTKLIMDCEKYGLKSENGLRMLVAQAKEAAELFSDRVLDEAVIGRIHKTLVRQTENIILIGMPGSGKSTLGQMLAKKLDRQFIDIDDEIIRHARLSIPDIFSQKGEKAFRDYETRILAEFCKKSGLVIATGGGCVTREDNYPLLHQNGLIICLERSIEKLPTQGRPLSRKGSLEEMYALRKPLYKSFADHTIRNDSLSEEALSQILELLEVSP